MESPTPVDTPRPLPHRRRWLRRLLAAGGTIFVAACIVHFAVLPWIVRENVATVLAGLGFDDARFEVRRAWPWRTTLADLSAAGGDLRVASVDVTYSPIAVLRGKLNRVVIERASIRVS